MLGRFEIKRIISPFFLPFSQSCPSHPNIQLQLYDPLMFKHVALLKQG